MMELSVSIGDSLAVFTPKGQIDEQGAEDLKTKFKSLDVNKIKDITLDFSNVTHIGSAGIGKLLLIYKDIAIGGGQIQIINVSSTIYSLFAMLKLDSVFTINQV